MNITLFTDYSLRTLLYLAVKTEELCTIKDISDSYGISKNHLMKVVQQLNNLGYVLAIRGKNGGLKLNRPAREINVGLLVQELEKESKLLECFTENNTCIITPACHLKNIMAEAMDNFYKTLEKYTIEDLLLPQYKGQLAKILITDAATRQGQNP